jgi:Na+/H+ antiporter NhaB
MQTADMLSLYKSNGQGCESTAGVLLVYQSYKELKSVYACSLLMFTGIDREVGNIITYGFALVSQVTPETVGWAYTQFFKRCELVKKPVKKLYVPL